jgi:hypothetical protein
MDSQSFVGRCPIYECVFVNRLIPIFRRSIRMGVVYKRYGLNHLFGIGDWAPSPYVYCRFAAWTSIYRLTIRR